MELTILKCTSCGANLEGFQDKKEIKCKHCGTISIPIKPAKFNISKTSLSQDDNKRLSNLVSIMENAISAGNYPEAYIYCNKALEVDPTVGSLWLNKALCAFWLRDNKTIIYDQGNELLTYLRTAKINNPDIDEYEEITKNIASSLYHYCFYKIINIAPDEYNSATKTMVFSNVAVNNYLLYLKTVELCFEISNETYFLKNIIKEISGYGKLNLIKVDKNGCEQYTISGNNLKNKFSYDAIQKRIELGEKIRNIEPDYVLIEIQKPKKRSYLALWIIGSIVITILIIIVASINLNTKKSKKDHNIIIQPINNYYHVNASGLYMRSGPSESNMIMLTIPQNDSVKLLEVTNNKWTKIDYKGNVGYVHSEYLKE